MALSDLIIAAESGGNPYARNPRSSAAGLGQFIDSTWLDMITKYRPDLIEGKSRDQVLALKTDPALSRSMTDYYAAENAAKLQGAGFPATSGSQYLAHFAGPQGAIGLLSADKSVPVASVLGPKVMQANPFLSGMTAGDMLQWADRKMGGPVPQPAQAAPVAPQQSPMDATATAGATPSPSPGMPLDLASFMAAPSAPTGQQPNAQLAALIAAMQPQAEEQSQMILPNRPKIDLGQLFAARRTQFKRG